MFSFKKSLIFFLITILILFIVQPIFASDETAFVWSTLSSPTVQTATSINQDKR